MMERVPRTGLFMYHQSTAPAPPPDLPPVVAPVSTEPVSAPGHPPMVPAVVRHHCGSNSYSACGTFGTSHVHSGPGCSDVGGDHLEECVYLHEV